MHLCILTSFASIYNSIMLPALIGLTAAAAASAASYQCMAPTGQWCGRTFASGIRGSKQIALTYDDGPNDPHTLNSAITDPTAYVTGGKTQPVTVPVTYMKLNVYTGSKTTPGGFQETTAYPVTITNTACTSVTPNNETAINEPKETQDQTINSTSWPEYGGHLEHPFLPFGPGQLCLAYNSGSKHYTYTTTYKLTAEGEYVRNIYLSEAGAKYEETLTGPGGSETYKVVIASAGTGTATCT